MSPSVAPGPCSTWSARSPASTRMRAAASTHVPAAISRVCRARPSPGTRERGPIEKGENATTTFEDSSRTHKYPFPHILSSTRKETNPMQQQLANLLALLPEEKHDEFLSRLPTETAAAIANEADDVDEATLQE